MMHLSFEQHPDSVPLCVVRGGELNKNIIYINSQPDRGSSESAFSRDIDLSPYLKGLKLTARERTALENRVRRALLLDHSPDDDAAAKLFEKAKEKRDSKTSISADDGTFQVIPNPDTRDVIFAFGASGSGKSWWIKNYLKEFRRMFPSRKIYMFSRLKEDPSMDEIPMQRVVIDEDLLEAGINCDDFPEGSCLCFDDVDSLDSINPKLKKAIYAIMQDVLEVGRHRNLYCLITAHLGSNYRDTRSILNEAHYLVCYPHGSTAKSLNYVLGNYGGLDKSDIRRVLKLPSRWVCLRKHYPPAVVHEHGCYLVSDGH